MTVTATDRRAGPFYGNGVTTQFPFTFKVFSADDLEVTYANAAGVASVITSGFTVTLNADQDANPGGYITYPLSGSPMASPASLVAIGATAYSQPAAFSNVGRFLPEVHERAFDRQAILSQQLAEKLGRQLTIPPDGPFPVTALPTRASRYDRLLCFADLSGQPNVTPFTVTQVASAIAAAYTGAAGPVDALSFIQSGTGAVTRTAQAKMRERVSPEDYGAVGDGMTNDRTAFTNAFAAARWLELTPGKTYYLGQQSSNSAIFSLSGTNGRGMRFNGAEIVVQTSGGNYNAPLFQLDNMTGFTLEGPRVRDTGFDQSVTWKGISLIRLHPATGEVVDVQVRGAYLQGVVAAIDADTAANRAKKIWFDGDIENCYYGINLGNNGDALTAFYRTYNAVRSYFCYGIRDHEVFCISDAHAAAGNADFLIKCRDAAFPTHDIRARFVSKGSLATTNPQLVFESHNNSGNAAIWDVTVDYCDRQSPGLSSSIAFRHYNDAGVLQSTDPNTKANIIVRGYAGSAIETLSVPTTIQKWYLDAVRPLIPAFRAFKSAVSSNVTGAGTSYIPIFDTVEYDLGSNYNAGNGIFTAPWDGYYTFAYTALVTDLSTAAALLDMTIVTTGRTYNQQMGLSPATAALQQAATFTVPRVYMAAGQTASCRVRVTGMAGNTADLYGDATTIYTSFSGFQERTWNA